ncbi:MAG: hypothetical protein A2V77_19855 [Anaeromyxobacter sp. RBG_16_69_14]|nr:MAG: hypothetical protein A2V77_19855 [Anaeromyxobacter sp. RBG_16_69_14]
MVAAGDEGGGQAGVETLAAVVDRARLAVDDAVVADHLASEGLADGLVPQADAQDGQRSRQVANGWHRDARFLRRARAGRQHEAVRAPRPDA